MITFFDSKFFGTKMKIRFLFVVMVGAAIVLLLPDKNNFPDVLFTESSSSNTKATTIRKLKETKHDHGMNEKIRAPEDDVHLDDYHPIDPVPSSKASIRPGPIQHGTPLNPYIPKPTPPGPGHPKIGGGSP